MATVKELSIEDKLNALYELQSLHSKIDNIRKLRGELPLEVRDLEDELSGLGVRVTKIETEIEEIHEEINRLKILAKESESSIIKYEKQINTVKNNREYDALSKEIENAKLDVGLAEKRAKDANEVIKQKNVYLSELAEQIAKKNEDLANKRKELEVIIQETGAEEKALESEIESASANIEGRLKNAYNKIRENYRNGLAVVNIDRDACGGCFAKIPPQRQSEIRSGKKIIVCEYCGRILVYREIPRDENAEEEVPKKRTRTSRRSK